MVQSFNSSGTRLALSTLWQSIYRLSLEPFSTAYRPHIIVNNIAEIEWERLRHKGTRILIFDKDNCLTRPYSNQIHPPLVDSWEECKRIFRENIYILSNSAGSLDDKDYNQEIESALGVTVIRHSLKKPDGGGQVLCAINDPPPNPSAICMIGDRLMTDVAFGKLNGMLTIWTRKPIDETADNRMAVMMRHFEQLMFDSHQGQG